MRPNANFGVMNYVSNIMNGSYNAMILTLRRTVGSVATFQSSYTLAHTMSDINANTRFDHDIGFNVPDPQRYHSYYSNANWDVRNRFSFSGVYNIPGMKKGIGRVLTEGWEVSAIAAIQSGTPFGYIRLRHIRLAITTRMEQIMTFRMPRALIAGVLTVSRVT